METTVVLAFVLIGLLCLILGGLASLKIRYALVLNSKGLLIVVLVMLLLAGFVLAGAWLNHHP